MKVNVNVRGIERLLRIGKRRIDSLRHETVTRRRASSRIIRDRPARPQVTGSDRLDQNR